MDHVYIFILRHIIIALLSMNCTPTYGNQGHKMFVLPLTCYNGMSLSAPMSKKEMTYFLMIS